MWELTKSFRFEAAHALPGTTLGAASEEIHGHSFRAEVSIRGTPDPDTGIGKWSLAAFTRAMRNGIGREGHHLYPVLPYPHFTRASNGDIAALYAFIMTRAAVHQTTPENALPFLDPEKLIVVTEAGGEVSPDHPVAAGMFEHWIKESGSFSELALMGGSEFNFSASERSGM